MGLEINGYTPAEFSRRFRLEEEVKGRFSYLVAQLRTLGDTHGQKVAYIPREVLSLFQEVVQIGRDAAV